jgi:hypothetical protein
VEGGRKEGGKVEGRKEEGKGKIRKEKGEAREKQEARDEARQEFQILFSLTSFIHPSFPLQAFVDGGLHRMLLA